MHIPTEADFSSLNLAQAVQVLAYCATTPQNAPVQKARDDSTGSRIPKADTIAHSAEVASYTVQRGETLVSIAKKKLGSSARWPELAKLNEDSVPDPHALVPGTVIRIPRSS